jgi:drug/metabolite transporter (DMT)-like permease
MARPAPDLVVSTSRWPVVVLLLGACAIGFAPILIRLTETGSAAGGFWRMAFALPLLALPALKEGRAGAAAAWKRGLLAGLLFALDLAAWHYGVAFTSVANATALSNTTPVVVTLAAWLLFGERPARAFVIALVFALGGAFLMAAAKGSGGLGTNPPLGDVLAAVAAVFYGGYFVVIRLARAHASTSQLMFWSSVAGAPVLLLMALLLGEDLTPETWGGWAACVGLGVMHATGQGAIAWALGRLPASLTSVTVLVQPVVAAGLGWQIFGEGVVPLQVLGAAVLLTGVVLAQRSQRPKPAPPLDPVNA